MVDGYIAGPMADNMYHIMSMRGKWLVFVERSSQAAATVETKREALEWCQRDSLDSPGEAILVYQGSFLDFKEKY
jgi:hypothetical protein